MNASYAKALAIILVVVLVINVTLLALNKIHEIVFWIIIIVIAVFAYKILPMVKI